MNKQTEHIEALLKEISDWPWVSRAWSISTKTDCYMTCCTGDGINKQLHLEANANAKFIAAAPEIITSLLEQIKELKELNIYLAGLLNENYDLIKQKDMEIKHLYSNPPCRECGAMTEKEAETKCNCLGDRDYCHGCELWDK